MKKLLLAVVLLFATLATASAADGTVTNASAEYERGKAEAIADLKTGTPRYFLIGQPLSADSRLASILKEDYGLTLVGLGCVPVPPVGEHADGYNAAVSKAMAERFGTNWWNAAWQKGSVQRDRRREAGRQGTNKASEPSVAPATQVQRCRSEE